MKKKHLTIALVCSLLAGVAVVGTIGGLTRGFRDWNIADNVSEIQEDLRQPEFYGYSLKDVETVAKAKIGAGYDINDYEIVDFFNTKDLKAMAGETMKFTNSSLLNAGETVGEVVMLVRGTSKNQNVFKVGKHFSYTVDCEARGISNDGFKLGYDYGLEYSTVQEGKLTEHKTLINAYTSEVAISGLIYAEKTNDFTIRLSNNKLSLYVNSDYKIGNAVPGNKVNYIPLNDCEESIMTFRLKADAKPVA